MGDRFTGQKTQSTVSKCWRKRRYKSKQNPEKANNTEYSNTVNRHTYNPLVYNNTMGWLVDRSHRGQGRQAWTAVGLPPRYPPGAFQFLFYATELSCLLVTRCTGRKRLGGSRCRLAARITVLGVKPIPPRGMGWPMAVTFSHVTKVWDLRVSQDRLLCLNESPT